MKACKHLVSVLALTLCGTAVAQEMTAPELVKKVQPCIVRIIASGPVFVHDPVANKDVPGTYTEVGTGFFISGSSNNFSGYIVTNSHVVRPELPRDTRWQDDPPKIKLEIGIAGEYRNHAKLIANDELGDLAILQQDALAGRVLWDKGTFEHLNWADPDKIQVGEPVIAIGFARAQKGLPSVTKGIVSGRKRDLACYGGLIQTDAAINLGNSGGPLLNMRGEVVGVNTYTRGARVTANLNVDVSYGMSYARDCRTAAPFAELLKKGPIKRPELGIDVVTLNQLFTEKEGVIVKSVLPNSRAAKTDLKQYDLIVGLHYEHAGKMSPPFSIGCVGDYFNALALVPPDSAVWLDATSFPAADLNAALKVPAQSDEELATKLTPVYNRYDPGSREVDIVKQDK